MYELPGYRILEKIYESSRTIAYRAQRLSDHEPVVLKTLKETDYPSLKSVAALRHEYHLLQKISSPGIVKAYELIKQDNNWALVLEDVSGITLKDFIKNKPLELSDFFKIALQLVNIIQVLHKNKIIHKDIKPANIIISPSDLTVKLVDFSVSSEVSIEIQNAQDLDALVGTLAYISPEQTGRMNRVLDYRTDFYSLGVTLYEMLTGRLPFKTIDPVELVHNHLAVNPISPTNLRPEIPKTLSLLVLKLLAKNAEDRYISIIGLKSDLIESARQWNEYGDISHFKLGSLDQSDQLYIPQKLYGREKQIQELNEAFQRVKKGEGELLQVTGYAGIGKSALVYELQRSVLSQDAYFISGKYDQLRRTDPYTGIIMAFNDLIAQLLTEPDYKLKKIKEDILQAVKKNGRVILDVIPRLEKIIGEQPSVQELGGMEAQNRFNLVFQDFVSAIATDKHPLVLFLDDLQWVDTASLKLLEQLLTASPHLLVIISYRDKEVTNYHPLKLSLQAIENFGTRVREVHLSPLTQQDISQLLSDTLQTNLTVIKPLAAVVFNKTHGNPLFVNEFLKSIHQKHLLQFSYDTNKWEWDIPAISELSVTDNVVDLISTEIHRLKKEAKDILKLAACIGGNFDLHTLALISDKTHKEVVDILSKVIDRGFILPMGDNYKQAELLDSLSHSYVEFNPQAITYKFTHDRIQLAAYNLIPETEKPYVHLYIGRILIREHESELVKKDDILFDVLSHFNKSADLIESTDEREKLARYNLIAGTKAKNSNAYGVATGYFNSGLSFLDKVSWYTHHDLMFAIYKGLAECKSLTGELKTAEIYYNVLLLKAKDSSEKIEIYRLMLLLYSYLSRYKDVNRIGKLALKHFNIKFPEKINKFHIFKEIIKIKWKTRFHRLDKISKDLTLMEDKRLLQLMDIFATMQIASYQTNLSLFAFITCKMISLSLKHGFSKHSALACETFAVILISYLHNFENGMKFSKLGLHLANKFNDAGVLSKVYSLYAFSLNHWENPLSKAIDYLNEAYQYAIESGELLWAIMNRTSLCGLIYFVGKPLSEILDQINTNLEFLKRIKEAGFYNLTLFIRKIIASAQDSENVDMAELDRDILFIKKKYGILLYSASAILLASSYFMSGNSLRALRILDEVYSNNDVRKYLALFNIQGLVLYTVCIVMHFKNMNRLEKYDYLRTLKYIQKRIKLCYEQNPKNFKTLYLFVEAELAILNDKKFEAERLYDEAISDAKKQDLTQYIALINERAGQLYLSENRSKIARTYFKDAYYAYLNRGVITKVNLLKKFYSQWLTDHTQNKNFQEQALETVDESIMTHAQALDLMSALKATQAISSEIVLDNFLQKMMRIVLENAGAERGFLLIETRGKWVVVAEGNLDMHKVISSQMQSISERKDLPHSLVMYVARTHDDIILNDARSATRLVKDEYISRCQPKSVLCMPIMYRAKLSAILYVENNLTVGAFTAERLRILKLLASQAAISLENARLYTASGRFVPHEFLSELNKSTLADVHLGDQIQLFLTIMFCDIRDFTTISEKLSSAKTFQLINEFFGNMEPIVGKHNGFVDKYIGDAIMALFDKEVEDALYAAIEMITRLKKFNEERIQQDKIPIDVGIGLNTGELMLGIIGDKHRMESSVIGDAVNIAARIEKLTRYYNVRILITGATKTKLKNPNKFNLRLIGEVKVKGKTKSVELWEVFDIDPPELKSYKTQTLDTFERARDLYQEKKYTEAKKLFESVLDKNLPDTVVMRYIKNCDIRAQHLDDGVKNFLDEGKI